MLLRKVFQPCRVHRGSWHRIAQLQGHLDEQPPTQSTSPPWRYQVHKRRIRTAFAAGAVAASLVGATTATAVTGHAATVGCQVAYTVGSQWTGGFTANIAITNLGSPVTGWTLRWTFGAGQSVTQAWSATITQSGTAVTAANL